MGEGGNGIKATTSMPSSSSRSSTSTRTRRRRRSVTAILASSFVVAYAFALGTQFKMMGIVSDQHARGSTGGHHVTDVATTSGGGGRRGGMKKRMRSMVGGGDGGGGGEGGEEGGTRGGWGPRIRRPRPATDAMDDGRAMASASGVVVPPSAAGGVSSFSSSHTNAEMASSIARKWNLTTHSAIDLLMEQFDKVNDYNPHTDFVHFHHLYKSGGTSISNLMDKTLGTLMNGGILPGSYESGNFDHDEALNDIERRLSSGTSRNDLPYLASYAHTGLRPVYGPRRTKTGIFLSEQLPHRRLRVVTMLRDIVDFRASNHAMIMCGLNYEVTRWNNMREASGLSRVCSPRDGLNISEMVDRKMADLMERCRSEKNMMARGETPKKKLHVQQIQQCTDEEMGIDTLAHCRSADHLLASPQYDKHYRSMFQALMGRFHRDQKFTNVTAYKGMGYGFDRAEISRGYSVEKVEEYTLQDLGGLDATISGAGDGVGPPEPDFVWFGITERMKESTALFYYQFRVKPLPRTPVHRVQECRPNSWWTEKNREVVKEREPADYAVWRAANAIMDVRMEKMKMEVRSLLRAGETRESLYYVDWDQLEEMGVEL